MQNEEIPEPEQSKPRPALVPKLCSLVPKKSRGTHISEALAPRDRGMLCLRSRIPKKTPGMSKSPITHFFTKKLGLKPLLQWTVLISARRKKLLNI